MPLLDELLQLPSSTRRLRLGHADIQEAILQLGMPAGLAWLERRIESPVGPEWGDILFRLNPGWQDLERWTRLDKIHCLAATDAILQYTHAAELPPQASAASIHAALDDALTAFGNYRLKLAAKKIRYVWPLGARIRHPVAVPHPLEQAAEILLHGEIQLIKEWLEAMATAMDPTESVDDIWESLITFGASRNFIAVFDWSNSVAEAVVSLRNLHGARALKIDWQALENMEAQMDDALQAIGNLARRQGYSLVSLSHVSEDFTLTILKADAARSFENLIASLGLSFAGVRLIV